MTNQASGPKGMKAGSKVNEALLEQYTTGQWRQILVDVDAVNDELEALKKQVAQLAAHRRIPATDAAPRSRALKDSKQVAPSPLQGPSPIRPYELKRQLAAPIPLSECLVCSSIQ